MPKPSAKNPAPVSEEIENDTEETENDIELYRAKYPPRLLVVREILDYIVPSCWIVRPHTGIKPGWVELVRYGPDGTRLHGVEMTPAQAKLVGEALIACAQEQEADAKPSKEETAC